MKPGGGGGPTRWAATAATPHGRDSDASLYSNRPSFASSVARTPLATPSAAPATAAAVMRSINAYLSSRNCPVALRSPYPSNKDISDAFRFLFSRLHYPLPSNPSASLDEDILVFLQSLGYPGKLTKSALKAPSTPHAWPLVRSALHWLVQTASYADSVSASPHPFASDRLLCYLSGGYSLFLSGDDLALEELDQRYIADSEAEVDANSTAVDGLERERAELEARLEASAPSSRAALEKKRAEFAADSWKFQAVVDSFSAKAAETERVLAEREGLLEGKEKELVAAKAEVEALRVKVGAQAVSGRDAERMRREIAVVDRDVEEAETARNAWEDKCWELDAEVSRQMKELESLAVEGNAAIKSLKLGCDFKYNVNMEGSSPGFVIGADYKSKLKPALTSLAEDVKKSSVAKLEEFISLQKQSQENGVALDAKRKRLAELQSKIDESHHLVKGIAVLDECFPYIGLYLVLIECTQNTSVNSHPIISLKTSSRAEAEALQEDVKRRTAWMISREKKTAEYLEIVEHKLQAVIKQSEEETQAHERQCLGAIDMISSYKEHTLAAIAEMKKGLSGAVREVEEMYESLPVKLGMCFTTSS
ncbi:hypothetical protein QJS04_geneDACA018620 [Acorus gramineus]|uniref:Kinetochore protein NDC80 n=1 Tax=Acorus gramineus TaxID=55184 RepID=A0AAV9AJP7_ACOGR|nr:hypothetical protein QJS04_geneDACA018620 [Acorus gramineus]